MSHNYYITVKRAKFNTVGGAVNIPYGTRVEAKNNALFYNGKPICAEQSKCSHDYFAHDDDGNGLIRGKLTQAIIATLTKQDKMYQARWDKVWDDKLCQKYRRSEHEDHWLWNHDFYNAAIEDLTHIAKLVGAKEGK